MLVGIVAMQVELLKLNAGIGRSMQQATQLTSRNETLRASVAGLGDDQRIESVAAKMGLIMPAPSAVGFLSVPAASAQKAVAVIRAPNASQFLSASTVNGGVAGATPTVTSAAAPPTSVTPIPTSVTPTTTSATSQSTSATPQTTGGGTSGIGVTGTPQSTTSGQ
jgi:cell division protein FtsL